jgi:hypothetical protein
LKKLQDTHHLHSNPIQDLPTHHCPIRDKSDLHDALRNQDSEFLKYHAIMSQYVIEVQQNFSEIINANLIEKESMQK